MGRERGRACISIIASVEQARLNPGHRALLDGLLSAQVPGVLAVQTVEEEDGRTQESRSSGTGANGASRSAHRAGPPSGARVSADGNGVARIRSGIDKLVDLDLAYLVPRDRLNAEPLEPNEALDEAQADERGRVLESLDDIVW